MSPYRIAVGAEEPFRRYVKLSCLRELARRVLEAEGAKPVPRRPAFTPSGGASGELEKGEALGLSIVIAGEETMRALNARYLGEDAPTDVLAFPLGEGEPFPRPRGQPRPLGEVIISLPMAQRQAQEQGHSLEAELARLLVHGLLHLLGYDHAQPEEERIMTGREQELLAGLERFSARA